MTLAMKTKTQLLLLVLFILSNTFILHARELVVSSPDNKIKTVVTIDKEIHFSVSYSNTQIIKPSLISIEIEGIPEASFKVRKS